MLGFSVLWAVAVVLLCPLCACRPPWTHLPQLDFCGVELLLFLGGLAFHRGVVSSPPSRGVSFRSPSLLFSSFAARWLGPCGFSHSLRAGGQAALGYAGRLMARVSCWAPSCFGGAVAQCETALQFLFWLGFPEAFLSPQFLPSFLVAVFLPLLGGSFPALLSASVS